jgi:NAD(P)-dependent dehydrogenase (short-subunit alcohol dehydrogenase family)
MAAMKKELRGQVAIVTGGSRGIGLAIARALVAEGINVAVTGRNDAHLSAARSQLEGAGPGSVETLKADVRSYDEVERAVAAATARFGGLDIVVNNAGILRDKMGYNMDESDWDSVIDVHLKGHFAMTHFAAKYWRARSKAGDPVYGRIINTSSESGLFGNAGQANYAAAKAGIVALTVVTARELAKIGVTANAIAPRARTRMTEKTFAGFGAVAEGEFDAWAPDNVSPVVGWLASPAAADVSGQVFIVWGSEVQVARTWTLGGSVNAGDTAWTVDTLTAAASELFATHDRGVPPFMLESTS